jgi:7-cyano-7-deazaguanine synthase
VISMEGNHVLMFSGGLDSYLALLTLLDNGIEPKLVYSSHGSKNHFEQLHFARVLARKHGLEVIVDDTLNLGSWEEKNAFIPNRNGFLAFVGSLYGDTIHFAIMDGEQTYTDCRQDTFLALSMSLTKLSGKPVTVGSPFWNLTKAEVIGRLDKRYHHLLPKTYSCHRGGSTHCGYCSACFRRATAFILNDIEDEDYEVNPFKTGLAEQYYNRVTDENLNSGYGEKRDKEILEALIKSGEWHV